MDKITENKNIIENNRSEKEPDILSCRDVNRVKYGKNDIYIIGTAHVSRESQAIVKRAIETIKPDIVCIELDEKRYETLTSPDRWETLNIFEIIKKKQTFFLIAQLVMAGFQKKIGEKLGVKPGSEMLEAINTAKHLGIPVDLVDRSAGITLKRAWRKTPFTKKFLLFSNLLAGFFSKQEIDEEELTNLRKSDIVTEMMKDLKKYMPETKSVVVDERDQYIVSKTLKNKDKDIVLIVGAGHVHGILDIIKENKKLEHNLKELESIPELSFFYKILPWLIPTAIFLLIAYGFIIQDYSTMKKGAAIWILANGIFAAIGSTFALPHPLSVVTAFISAPITSLNPTIGCGFVVALAEAFLRKPRVIDIQNLSSDISGLKGWYRNRLTRILMVFAGASMGSAAGTWIAISWFIAT